MERKSGIRRFSDRELEALRLIECLKKSGLEIKDIKQFMIWAAEGPSSYSDRKALIEARKAVIEAELAKLKKALDMLKFKCWYYDTAIRDGNEDRLREMIPDKLPPDIQKLFDNAHA